MTNELKYICVLLDGKLIKESYCVLHNTIIYIKITHVQRSKSIVLEVLVTFSIIIHANLFVSLNGYYFLS